jgi:hypothetical protein
VRDQHSWMGESRCQGDSRRWVYVLARKWGIPLIVLASILTCDDLVSTVGGFASKTATAQSEEQAAAALAAAPTGQSTFTSIQVRARAHTHTLVYVDVCVCVC